MGIDRKYHKLKNIICENSAGKYLAGATMKGC